jgi:hypothetical protein
MRRHRTRLSVVLGFLLLSTAAILSVSPPGVAQQGFVQCQIDNPQPEHPLEMNTVVSDPRTSQFATPLVKHVIMEKFVWECVEDPGTPEERPFIRDQEIFIEIIQRVQAGRTITVEKRVEEAVCDKFVQESLFTRLAVGCSTREVPLPEVPSQNSYECGVFSQSLLPQPTDPVEMNTVITARQDTVVTMKVEKELLSCRTAGTAAGGVGHLFLFTEMVERRAGATGADTIRPTEKKFQAIMCISRQGFPVGECGHFVPTAPPPA